MNLEEKFHHACWRLMEMVDIWGTEEEAEPTKDLVSQISSLFAGHVAELEAITPQDGKLVQLKKENSLLEERTQQLRKEREALDEQVSSEETRLNRIKTEATGLKGVVQKEEQRLESVQNIIGENETRKHTVL
jgi:peptidoglycan hydrolase CwlO-like protein